MSRTSIVLLSALGIGAIVAAIAATGESETETLQKRVAELEGQLTSLRSELNSCQGRLAQSGALESEAQAALAEVKKLSADGKNEEAREKMTAFQTKYASTQAAKGSSAFAQEIQILGKETPKDWGIEKWFQGQNDVELNGKKTTLVVFWETWCPHCRREVPKLQELYEAHKAQGLQVVGLTRMSKNGTEEQVTSFLSENKVTYPVAKENGQSSSYFLVQGIPAAAMLKDGKVVWRGHPATLTEEMLKKWL